MAMVKAGLAGAALGALGLATVMFVAPIAAQGPGGPPPWADGWRGQGGPGGGRPRGTDDPDMRGPGMMGQGQGRGDVTGPGMMGRPGRDTDDGDITGPRGDMATCQERLAQMARWRLARVQRLVRPTEEQRGAFEELRMASVRSLDIMRAACAAERPLTPPGRMAAAEKWLEARLQAVKVMRPALDNFYKLLSDEQKIRWSMGSRLGRGDDDHTRWFDRPGSGWGGGQGRMDRGYGGPGGERPEQWRERFQRDRDAGPPDRSGNRFDEERNRRPPERWGDRRRDDGRDDWGDNRRRPPSWDRRGGDDPAEERL